MRVSWAWALGMGMMSMSWRGARADELRAPQNVGMELRTPESAALATRSATAEMNGKSAEAVQLADQAIRANPRDPWPYYDKGMALARLGRTDEAAAVLLEAEHHFSPADAWGKSVAIYGRAYAFSVAGRCAEARQAFEQYAAFVKEHDPKSADMARRYAANCRAPVGPPAAAPRATPPAP